VQHNPNIQPPIFPYPFDEIQNQTASEEVNEQEHEEGDSDRQPSKSLFGASNSNLTSVPRTIGNVFS
jgi:hypothetical protein